MLRVFISYRRDDAKWQAREIYRSLVQVLPRDHVFMDIDSIPPGANFRKILNDWVVQCEVLLALIGPGWMDATDPKTGQRRLDNPRDFVRIEIGEALAREIPVVPVLIDGAPLPDSDLLPADLKGLVDRQAVFPDRNRFMGYAARVMRGLIVDFARQRRAIKRGGEFHITQLDATSAEAAAPSSGERELQRLSDALDELATRDPRLAEIVDLKYFCGLSLAEIASLRSVSERTVRRDWEKARLVLYHELEEPDAR